CGDPAYDALTTGGARSEAAPERDRHGRIVPVRGGRNAEDQCQRHEPDRDTTSLAKCRSDRCAWRAHRNNFVETAGLLFAKVCRFFLYHVPHGSLTANLTYVPARRISRQTGTPRQRNSPSHLNP